jgi:hypothetical protein
VRNGHAVRDRADVTERGEMTIEEENNQLYASLSECFYLICGEWGTSIEDIANHGWNQLPNVAIGAKMLLEREETTPAEEDK